MSGKGGTVVNSKNCKVLIVDDACFTREYIGKAIENIGFKEIFFAEDGLEAIEKAKQLQPSIITLDISMPGIDGLEAISKIAVVSSNSKIIMVSAAATPYIVIQAIQNGAVDFVPKPFTKLQLEGCIKKYI